MSENRPQHTQPGFINHQKNYDDLMAQLGMSNWQWQPTLEQDQPATDPTGHHMPPSWAGNYRGHRERASLAAEYRDRRAETDDSNPENPKSSAYRERVLEEVNQAFAELAAASHPDTYIDVIEKAKAGDRAAQKLRLGRIIGRGAVADGVFTISEYVHGANSHASNQAKWKVSERVDGWLIPRRLMAGTVDSSGNRMPRLAPDGRQVLEVDIRVPGAGKYKTIPKAKDFDDLVIAYDGRSWKDAYIPPLVGDTDMTVGVRQDQHHAGKAVSHMDTPTLEQLREALKYMAQHPLHPINSASRTAPEGPAAGPTTAPQPPPPTSPAGGRHTAPETLPMTPDSAAAQASPATPPTPSQTAPPVVQMPTARPRRRATSGVFNINDTAPVTPHVPQRTPEQLNEDKLLALHDEIRAQIKTDEAAVKAAQGVDKLEREDKKRVARNAQESVIRRHLNPDAPETVPPEMVQSVIDARWAAVNARKPRPKKP